MTVWGVLVQEYNGFTHVLGETGRRALEP